jgi:hypothetical protein
MDMINYAVFWWLRKIRLGVEIKKKRESFKKKENLTRSGHAITPFCSGCGNSK